MILVLNILVMHIIYILKLHRFIPYVGITFSDHLVLIINLDIDLKFEHTSQSQFI